METRKLANGIAVEIDVLPTDHGYMLVHRVQGRKEYTVTCSCEGKGSVSTTCSYPDGTPPSPTCDCTGATPQVSC